MSEDTTIADAKQKIVEVLIDMGADTYRWEDVNHVADRILKALIKQIVLDLVASPELERAVVVGYVYAHEHPIERGSDVKEYARGYAEGVIERLSNHAENKAI